jgi:hypothetical protein
LASFKTLTLSYKWRIFRPSPVYKNWKEKPFGMKTSTDRTTLCEIWEVVFAIDGVPLKLNIYKNIELSKQKNTKIICFALSDLTQEWKLYWRKVYWFDNAKGNTIAIDFNKSYNPYCAYNYKYLP